MELKILIRPILFLILILSVTYAEAQTRVISGQLKDRNGDAIPGVTILVEDSTLGTVTDLEGNYELEVPIGSTVLFQFIGYETQKMYIGPDEDDEEDTSDTKTYRHTIPNDPEKTLSPYFFIKGEVEEGFGMPLKSTHVTSNVTGFIADVEVKQVYVNNGEKPIEAIYIFPGSTRAAVHGMEMKVGNRILKAVIQEKKQARETYEKAKSEGKSATLLEQDRPNIFKMNIANILPGDTIEVTLHYTETLDAINGAYEFVYPTVVAPRYNGEDALNNDSDIDISGVANENWVQNPYLGEGVKPTSTFSVTVNLNTGIPIQQAFSKTHQVKVEYADRNKAQIVLADSESNGGNRDFILNYKLRGARTESGLVLYDEGDEQYFLLMIEPPENAENIVHPSREYIFIVDVSGSMSGFPLELSKKLMRGLLNDLDDSDKFNIMFFAGSNYLFSNKSVYATSSNIDKALKEVSRQSGGGGTQLHSCLGKALAMKTDPFYSRSFVVITDGHISVEKNTFELISSRLNDANLFALGIGSSVNRYLIEGMAYAGRGEKFIITDESTAGAVGKKFLDYIKHPALTDIKVDFGDLEVYDFTPSAIPDLFLRRPLAIHGKYKGELKTPIKISGRNGDGIYLNIIDPKANADDQNEALKYLWARDKIKYLSDYSQYYKGNKNAYGTYVSNPSTLVKQQVTELGLEYNLLTDYTSFVAVDSIVRNESQKTDKVHQLLPLPKGMSDLNTPKVDLTKITLEEDTNELEEIVVIGYGEQKRKEVTGAVSSVKGETIVNAGSIATALQGRVAGVAVVNSSGTPGGSANIMIRGISSVAGDSQPLYVVDGVPVDGIPELEPSQVNAIDVLKDAASTAIYGSRATNGVIIITTKEEPVESYIELNSQFSISSVGNLPDIQNQFGPLSESSTSFYSPQDYGWGGVLENPVAEVRDRFSHGFEWANTVTVLKKLKDHRFDISFGHTRESDIFESDKELSNLIAKYKYKKNGFIAGLNAHLTGVDQGLRDNLLSSSRYTQGIYSLSTNDASVLPDSNSFSNTNSWLQRNSTNSFDKRNGNGDLYLEKRIGKFELKGQYTVNLNQEQLVSGYGRGVAGESDGYLLEHNHDTEDHNTEFSVTRKSINGRLKLKNRFMIGYYNHQISSGIRTGEDQITSGSFERTNYRNEVLESIDTTQNRVLTSLINDLDYYGYLKFKYALTLENNSLFKENLLPAHSLGINLNITDLLDRYTGVLTTLGVRGTLNSSKVGYNYLGRVQSSDPTLSIVRFNSSPNLHLPYLSRGLAPETRTEWGIGIDALFWSSRIFFTADYYRTRIDNLIGNDWEGDGLEISNIADVEKRGLELALSADLLKGAFTWQSDLTFTQERSEVKGLLGGAAYRSIAGFDEVNSALVVGEQLGTLVTRSEDGTVEVIGTPNPDFVLNATQTFEYKSFDLNITMQYKNGGQVWNGTRAVNDYFGLSTNSLNFRSDNNTPDYRQDLDIDAKQYVEDASLFRLSSISLAYRLQPSWISRLHLKEVRLSLFANNLILISPYDGVDTENTISGDFSTYGIDLYNRPSSRSYGVSLRIKF